MAALKRAKQLILLIAGWLLFLSCENKQEISAVATLETLIESVKESYVPDRRDNVYEIRVENQQGKFVLLGFTSVEEAKTDLLQQASAQSISFVDSIIVLPYKTEDRVYGVINVSVADARMNASYSSEMGTQLLLGAPVEVLQPRSYWWRIKSAEGYVAWTTASSFVRMNKDEFNAWTLADKVIYTDDYGFCYEQPEVNEQRVSDLVFGCLLQLEGEQGRFFRVVYPDGRRGYVLKASAQPYKEWLVSRRLTEESIVQKAFSLKGIPYTWGGTSVKAMDCSGFVKTVMLMNGIVLRRDASQQVETGIPVDISAGYEHLRPGDLMFFGRKATDGKKERIRHVGFYIGNREFIHASGYVRINSLDPAKAHYDEGNTREFIRASRVIGAVGTKGIWEINQLPLYGEQK